MVDPFAAALTLIFNAPGSAAAIYAPPGGLPVQIRVITSQASAMAGAGLIVDTMILEIRKSDIELPVRRATLKVAPPGRAVQDDDPLYSLNADPLLDVEAMTWRCGAQPA